MGIFDKKELATDLFDDRLYGLVPPGNFDTKELGIGTTHRKPVTDISMVKRGFSLSAFSKYILVPILAGALLTIGSISSVEADQALNRISLPLCYKSATSHSTRNEGIRVGDITMIKEDGSFLDGHFLFHPNVKGDGRTEYVIASIARYPVEDPDSDHTLRILKSRVNPNFSEKNPDYEMITPIDYHVWSAQSVPINKNEVILAGTASDLYKSPINPLANMVFLMKVDRDGDYELLDEPFYPFGEKLNSHIFMGIASSDSGADVVLCAVDNNGKTRLSVINVNQQGLTTRNVLGVSEYRPPIGQGDHSSMKERDLRFSDYLPPSNLELQVLMKEGKLYTVLSDENQINHLIKIQNYHLQNEQPLVVSDYDVPLNRGRPSGIGFNAEGNICVANWIFLSQGRYALCVYEISDNGMRTKCVKDGFELYDARRSPFSFGIWNPWIVFGNQSYLNRFYEDNFGEGEEVTRLPKISRYLDTLDILQTPEGIYVLTVQGDDSNYQKYLVAYKASSS